MKNKETNQTRVDECIEKASNIVAVFRNNSSCELEARFGMIIDQKFNTGVSRTFMDDILEMMQKSSFMTGDEEWKEEMDVFYDYNGRNVRSRVTFDSNSMIINTHTTEKKILCKPQDFVDKSNEKENYTIRISLKSELEIKNPPHYVTSNLVRIKQRKRFTTENKIWAFDFSMTWSGKTKSEAEHSQINDDPVFEIECECIDPSCLSTRSDKYIAASLLLKMCDFLPKTAIMVPHF
jgi:hypothetical protein